MCFSSGGSGASAAAEESRKAAAEARAREEERQAKIASGTAAIDSAFKGFGDDFYTGRSNAYTDYANPQLEDQYSKAREQLAFALSRAGLSQSSEAAKQAGDLRKQYDLNKQGIVDTGLGYANDARKAVEQNRTELVSQLNATADPDQVAQSAAARAGTIGQLPTFSPLGMLFVNGTAFGADYLNARAAAARAGRGGAGVRNFGTDGSQSIIR